MARKKKEELQEQNLDVSVIYHEGDNIEEICTTLTGHHFMVARLLEQNGLNIHTLKDGDVLTWRI